jgi:hypothetical protein
MSLLTRTDQQLELIEDIDARVDRTNARVKNTTRRVDKLERNSRTTCMWICIVVLLLALIIVAIAAAKT